MSKRIARLWVLVAVAAAVIVPASALGGASVPYKGSDVGAWGSDGSNRCGALLPVWVETSGSATHVGRYQYSSRECADLGHGTFAGSFTLTAANGDRLVGRYAGTFTADAENIYYEQENTIEGGTGRFVGAAGRFHVSGIAALDGSGRDVQIADGTIASIGSTTG